MTSAVQSLSARWTGHALVDVGLAGVCAHSTTSGPVREPGSLTLQDLDAASDFIEQHYFSGALDSYLSVVFTNNSGYCGPNKVEHPREYAWVYRPHRVAPPSRSSAPAGKRCAFCGAPATVMIHRQHLPLFSADGVLNFRPDGEATVPACPTCLLALQFLPMACRRAEGRMLAVHADDPLLTAAFARKYLQDNKRLLQLALPQDRAVVHEQFEREQPYWDQTKKTYKMAAVTGPRSLVVYDLAHIAAATECRPRPVSIVLYVLSNSGQGPSIDEHWIPAGAATFVRLAAGAETRSAWDVIQRRFEPIRARAGDAGERGARRGRQRGSAAAAVPGRAGWSRNRAFEDLCDIFDAGFVDRTKAKEWLRRHVLGRVERGGRVVGYRKDGTPLWALANLFLKEVMGMKPARIEAIRAFADKLATHIDRTFDRKLLRALLEGHMRDVRPALLGAQRHLARDGQLLFGLDEYATVWLHEDGDEWLVRDLICIRLVERLHELGFFNRHPEEALPDAGTVGAEEAEKAESEEEAAP